MKLKNLYLGIIASTFLFASCSNDDTTEVDTPLGAYDNGVFITNEGNFGTPNASISFISNDLITFQSNLFTLVNPAKVLGDVAQSMSFADEKAFIVLNNSNEIKVVNRYTFESLGTITEKLKTPRYSTVLNGKLYVTNSGTKDVTVYDAKTYAYLTSIAVGKTVEKIISENGKLYITNGAYGSGSTVTVINPATNAIATTITVDTGVNSIEAKDGTVYVLCGNKGKSSLFKIDPKSDTSTVIESTKLTNALNMDIDGNKIYYTKGTGVYAMDLKASTFTETPLFSVTDSSWSTFYGFGVIDDKIYSGDANGFTADGIVTIYSTTGSLLKTVEVGVGPNGFYANN